MGGAAVTHHVLGEVLQKHMTLSNTFKHELKHTSGTNLVVLERFGANGEAAEFDGLLVARWNVQVLELLAAIPGQFIRPQLSALLGKYV